MAYEQKDNSGSVFINKGSDKYPLTDKSPTMTGKAMVGGVLYKVAAWGKKRDNGEKWLSFAFTPVEDQPAPQEDVDQSPIDDGDTLPF
jgi:hypothetical protein